MDGSAPRGVRPMKDEEATETETSGGRKARAPNKVIRGSLPYTQASGVFKKALDGIISASQPERFTQNFLETVIGVTGGSSRYVPPLLKKMGFLTSDGVPTELYTSFRTDGSRSSAAFEGLKNAFGELFQRNEFIHRASEADTKDNIVAITGLTKTDMHVGYIYSTFKVVRDFITNEGEIRPRIESVSAQVDAQGHQANSAPSRIGLVNNLNIVLPESTNITVYNLIFQSLRSNILG
jgi:hypothetical protein